MRPFRVCGLLSFLVVVVPACIGQTETTAIPLRILEEIPLPSLHLDSPAWRAIPGDGEFYVQNGADKYLALDLSGETKIALDLAKVPATTTMDPKDFFITDLAPDPRGGVIASVVWHPKPELRKSGILRFDDQGGFSGITWLQADFFVTHVAEFNSAGNYLVIAYDDQSVVDISLFDMLGKRLIAHVLPQKSTSGNPVDPGKKIGNISEQAIWEAGLTQIASGDDDSVYLFNPMKGRSVIRVQSSGEFSEIKLAEPGLKEGESTMPISMFVSHGNIYLYEAVLDPGVKIEEFSGGELKHFVLTVYDRYNGNINESFRDDGQIGAVPVSLGPRQFYFLKPKELPVGAESFSLIRAGR